MKIPKLSADDRDVVRLAEDGNQSQRRDRDNMVWRCNQLLQHGEESAGARI